MLFLFSLFFFGSGEGVTADNFHVNNLIPPSPVLRMHFFKTALMR